MPRRKIHVRDHDRRKPHKPEQIHVTDYTRMMETVVPRGYEEDYLRARKQFERRPEASKARDIAKEAKDTGLIDEEEHVAKWRQDPGRSDIAGIDEPYYGPKLEDLAVVKQVLRERLEKFSRKSDEIIRKAKAAITKVRQARRVPRREKKERVTRIKREAKREVEVAAKDDLQELKKRRGLIDRVVLAIKRWRPERRRRANYVAETTKCNVIEADALIRRARMKGWDYDTVDWDQLQGKDLQYDERVGKLEQMIGKTYTENEYESVIKSEQERWSEAVEQRRQEIDRIGEERRSYRPKEYEIPSQTFGYT